MVSISSERSSSLDGIQHQHIHRSTVQIRYRQGPPFPLTANSSQTAPPTMSQRYKKSVAAVMASEPEMAHPPYATRNKRRKLLRETDSPLPRNQPSKVFEQPLPQKTPDNVIRVLPPIRRGPVYGRNLGKALKSILSESPRVSNRRGGEEVGVETVEVTPWADEEASSGTVAVLRGNGRSSSLSISSQQSRETSPSSTLGSAALADDAPFIEFFKREKEQGGVSKEVKDEAMKILREWRTEWLAEDKRIRELKRKIKARSGTQSDVPPTPTSPEAKSRGRPKLDRPSVESNTKSVDSSKTASPGAKESDTCPSDKSNSESKRDSIAGPNGLTGNYWNTTDVEMGRGNRRKSKAQG